MIWNTDLDDFKQVCESSTRRYPLMRLMEEVLGQYSTEVPPPTVTPPSTVVTSGAPTVTQDTDAPPTAGPTNPPTGNLFFFGIKYIVMCFQWDLNLAIAISIFSME